MGLLLILFLTESFLTRNTKLWGNLGWNQMTQLDDVTNKIQHLKILWYPFRDTAV